MFKSSWLHLAISFLVMPFCFLLFTGCGHSTAKAAVITFCEGDTQLQRAGASGWIAVEEKETLAENDVVKTGVNSRITITFLNGSTIELEPGTQVEIKELANGKTRVTRLRQEIGETWSKVEKLVDTESRYEIETPAAVAAVRGSQMIVVVIANGTTSVGNVEGSISVMAQGEEVVVPEGKHSTVAPGGVPGKPSEGTKALMIPGRFYPDSSGDLFNSQLLPVTGPDYLDIQSGQVSFIDGSWFLWMGVNSPLPEAGTVSAETLVEWNFLLDFDRNQTTGLSRPFISNDIGFDYNVQLSLENNNYSCRFISIAENTVEAVAFTVSDNTIEMVIPLTHLGNVSDMTPPAIDWAVAAIYYKDEDPRNTPSYTDKSPNEGHHTFELKEVGALPGTDTGTSPGSPGGTSPVTSVNPDTTTENPSDLGYSAAADFSTAQGNPNGAWSYGWMPADFSVFNNCTNYAEGVFNTRSSTGITSWYESIGVDRTPCIWMNTEDTAYGAPNGWLSLHPGPNKEPAVLRWKTPAAGTIQVTGEFLPGDRRSMTVAIRHNGREIWTADDAGSFNLNVITTAGDTVDFMVYGGYNYGNTPLSVTISYPK
jgi:hypothetical protein